MANHCNLHWHVDSDDEESHCESKGIVDEPILALGEALGYEPQIPSTFAGKDSGSPDRSVKVAHGVTVEQEDSCGSSEHGSARTEDQIACFVVTLVAVMAQITVTVTKNSNNVVQKTENTNEKAIEEDIAKVGCTEKTLIATSRRDVHLIPVSWFQTQAHGRRGTSSKTR